MKKTTHKVKCLPSLIMASVMVMTSVLSYGQLLNWRTMKTDKGAVSEQKALTISPSGELFYGINAKGQYLLKEDGSYDEVLNTQTDGRAGILIKINADGSFAWGNYASSSGEPTSTKNTQITSVTYGPDGYVYAVGGVTTNVGSEHAVTLFGKDAVSKGFMDYYLAKIDPQTGNAVWATTLGTAKDWDMFNGVSADRDGNVYVFQEAFDNANKFSLELADGTSLSLGVNGNWGTDALVIKFNAEGKPVWAKNFGSIFKDKGNSIIADNEGNVYLTGVLNSGGADLTNESEKRREVVFGNNTYYMTPEATTDAFLLKLSGNDGSVLWSKLLDGTGSQEGRKLALLSNNGIALMGVDQGQFFVSAYSSTGEQLWQKMPQCNGSYEYKSMSSDNSGNIFICGFYKAPITIEGITLPLEEGNEANGFIAKFTPEGNCSEIDYSKGMGYEGINHIAVNGSYIGICGDRYRDMIFPFADEISGFSARNVNGANHDFICAAYKDQPSIPGPSSFTAKRLVSFSYQIYPVFMAAPANYTFEIINGALPNGWTLDSSNGIISGRASNTGSGTFTVQVRNTTDNVTLEKEYSYTIEAKPCEILEITPDAISDEMFTGYFSQKFTLENSDGIVTWSGDNLPKGLSIDPATGVLSGTLQQTGSITFSLTATEESGCSKIQDYTINVSEFNYQAGPHVSWITPIYGSGFDHSKSSAIDKEGNIYFSTTYGDITFNESASFPYSSNPDALVAKYNGSNGTFMWGRRIGGAEVSGRNEQGQAVATDPTTGDIVFTGIVTPDALVGDLTSSEPIPTNGGRDMFLVRFNPQGNILWHKSIGSTADWEAGINTIFDKKGNIYALGYKAAGPINIELGDGTTEVIGDNRLMLIKFNGEGKAIWSKGFGSSGGSQESYGLVVDEANNVYISGVVNGGTLDFGNGKSVDAKTDVSFIAKYNENGVCQWVSQIGSAKSVLPGRGHGLEIDSQGNLYYATFSSGTIEIPNVGTLTLAGTNAVVYKFNPNGECISYIQLPASSGSGATSVHVDKNDNLYVVGYYKSDIILKGSVKLPLPPNAAISSFVAKYNKEGDLIWAMPAGNNISSGQSLTGIALSIDNQTDDLILSGPFSGKLYPQGYSGTQSFIDGGAFFVARYSQSAGIFAVLPEGKLNEDYTGHVEIQGIASPLLLKFSITGGALPAGLTMDDSGKITGKPTAVGKSTFTVKGTDGITTLEKEYSISIIGSDCDISIENIYLDDAENGVPYTGYVYVLSATGNVTWSFEDPSQVPYGLSIATLDSETGVISGTPNSPAKEYEFTVVAEDEAGCIATAKAYLNLTGTFAVKSISTGKISVYPNPVTDNKIFIDAQGLVSGTYRINIIDMKGITVYTANTEIISSENKSISVDNLPAGLYTLLINGNNSQSSVRIIKR